MLRTSPTVAMTVHVPLLVSMCGDATVVVVSFQKRKRKKNRKDRHCVCAERTDGAGAVTVGAVRSSAACLGNQARGAGTSAGSGLCPFVFRV